MHCGAAVAAPQTFALRARAPQPSTRHGKDNENNTENQANRAPEKDLQSKDFLGRGDVTEQNGRVAKASRLQSEVYGDEKARRRGAVPANPLGDRLPLFRRAWLSFIGFYRSGSRVRFVGSLLGSFAVYEVFLELYATILSLSR